MTVKLIVAVDKSNAIGWKDGRLPWHISNDLKRFKELTTGSTVLMGFKTFESLKRPEGLPNRRNVVMSRKSWKEFEPFIKKKENIDCDRFMWLCLPDSVDVITSWGWAEAHQTCLGCTPPDLWIVGGRHVYLQALTLNLVDEIHLTLVDTHSNADVKFPFDLSDIENFCEKQLDFNVKWSLVSQEVHLNEDIPYSFVTLKRDRESI